MGKILARIDLFEDGSPIPKKDVARDIVAFAVQSLKIASRESVLCGQPAFPSEIHGEMLLESGSAAEMCDLVLDLIKRVNARPSSRNSVISLGATFLHGEPQNGATVIKATFTASLKVPAKRGKDQS